MPDETYTYRWTSDWPATIADHTTPEGTGVSAVPGAQFSTIAPVDSPFAKPVNAAAKKAAKGLAEQTDDEGDENPSDDEQTEAAGGDSTVDDPTGSESADPEGAKS